jgi:hypothetical protein
MTLEKVVGHVARFQESVELDMGAGDEILFAVVESVPVVFPLMTPAFVDFEYY